MKSFVLTGMIVLSFLSSSLFANTSDYPGAKSKKQTAAHIININKAAVNELNHAYKGIGKRRAKAIVAYRNKYGPFQSVSELAKIRQVGKAFVKRNLSGLEKVFTVKQ